MKINYLFLIFFITCFATTVSAQKYKTTEQVEVSGKYGETTFTSSKSFYANVSEAPNFRILSKILKIETLRNTLENEEMVTLFAVADEAFTKLPKKSRDSILGNTDLMKAMVTFLAVPGRFDSKSIMNAVKKNGGKARLNTVEGNFLTITEEAGELVLIDENGNKAKVIAPDYYHKNGFFHIIDGLIFPPSE